MLRIVYFGSPEIAVSPLAALLQDQRFQVALVVTQAPKPVGRKGIITPSPVHQYAEKHGIPVYTPASLKSPESWQPIKDAAPDFFVVAAYGKILPNDLLAIPKYGPINIHPSLLPTYRGASPLQWSIMEENTETGVSIMVMDAEMDHGPLLAQLKNTISPEDTAETLGTKLFAQAAQALPQVLVDFAAGNLKPQEQDHTQATLTKLLEKEDGRIDWTKSAKSIEAKRRAFTPWPGIFTVTKEGKMIKILNCHVAQGSSQKAPGEFYAENGRLLANTGNGIVEITEVQPEGKPAMSAQAFINGYLK